MIERKKKPCKRCGELRFIWARGMCKLCCKIAEPERYRIKRESDKEKERLKRYRKARKEYLAEHFRCEVCGDPAHEIHHRKGRSGDLLWDKRYFLSVDRKCHERIEQNPKWAYENGYSLLRLEKKG